jgi:hypothetical protein
MGRPSLYVIFTSSFTNVIPMKHGINQNTSGTQTNEPVDVARHQETIVAQKG